MSDGMQKPFSISGLQTTYFYLSVALLFTSIYFFFTPLFEVALVNLLLLLTAVLIFYCLLKYSPTLIKVAFILNLVGLLFIGGVVFYLLPGVNSHYNVLAKPAVIILIILGVFHFSSMLIIGFKALSWNR